MLLDAKLQPTNHWIMTSNHDTGGCNAACVYKLLVYLRWWVVACWCLPQQPCTAEGHRCSCQTSVNAGCAAAAVLAPVLPACIQQNVCDTDHDHIIVVTMLGAYMWCVCVWLIRFRFSAKHTSGRRHMDPSNPLKEAVILNYLRYKHVCMSRNASQVEQGLLFGT